MKEWPNNMRNKQGKTDFLEILEYVKYNSGAAFFYSPAIYKDEFSYLMTEPSEILKSYTSDEFFRSIAKLDELSGQTAIGYVSYEACYLMEKKLEHLFEENRSCPLTKFYIYKQENVKKLSGKDISFKKLGEYKSFGTCSIKDFRINISRSEFSNRIDKIKSYIEAGDTYQVNYTVKGKYKFGGDIISLFISLIFNQSAKYIAFVNDGESYIISVSPELFFQVKGKTLTSKPMKGTVPRGYNPEADRLNYNTLVNSIKDRAENVMIVDLLRNDIGKISKTGTVKVSKLFEVEKYETLFQMTSTIISTLKPGVSISHVLKNLFPCGSITGAPKIRTIEIIKELELEKRNIYTGAVGFVSRDKTVFNVPIRTLLISKDDGRGEIGIGSGIVWDSNAGSEFNETKLKSNFLCKADEVFNIFTTMLIENNQVFLLEQHLARLRNTADYFLFTCDEQQLLKKLNAFLKKTNGIKSYRLKVSLDKWGNSFFEINEFIPETIPVNILVSKKKISGENKFQYFKTTNRLFYDMEYKKAREAGFGEVIFFNEKGELAEGAVTNIFIMKNGAWFTPKISSGILNGVYRDYLLKTGEKKYSELELTIDDLKSAEKIMLTNSLRKEILVSKLFFE